MKPTVTVCAVTGVLIKEHQEAINRTVECLPFPAKKLIHAVGGMDLAGYSKFMLKELRKIIDTDFALVVQADGYAINSRHWTNDFLEMDFCGAPMPCGDIGNGGFSLRSQKFMQLCSELPDNKEIAEDAWACQYHRKAMESAGVRFAPLDMAHQFSHEHDIPQHPGWRLQDSFGFHGKWHIK